MMKLIVEGVPQDIQFVISICRDKVRRGQLRLTPATDEAFVPDSKDVVVADSKDILAVDTKAPKKTRSKKSE